MRSDRTKHRKNEKTQNSSSGDFPKWNRNSVNLGILINHWNMNWSQFKDPVSHMCLAGSILVSNVGGGRFEPFYCYDKYFCHWIRWIQWKHLGKTQLGCESFTGWLIGHESASAREQCFNVPTTSESKWIWLEQLRFKCPTNILHY